MARPHEIAMRNRWLLGWVAAVGLSLLLHGGLLVLLARAVAWQPVEATRVRLDLWLGELASPTMTPAPQLQSVDAPAIDSVAPDARAVAQMPAETQAADSSRASKPRLHEPVSARMSERVQQVAANESAVDTRSVATAGANDHEASPSVDTSPQTRAEDGAGPVRLHLLDWLREHRVYPRAARRSGLEGRVELQFQVDRQGVVSNVHIAASSGHTVLDRAAEQLVRDASPFAAMPPMATDRIAITLPVDYLLDVPIAQRPRDR